MIWEAPKFTEDLWHLNNAAFLAQDGVFYKTVKFVINPYFKKSPDRARKFRKMFHGLNHCPHFPFL